MTDDERSEAAAKSFGKFWHVITYYEGLLRSNPESWEDKWCQELEDAYEQARPHLMQVSRPRMFHELPYDGNPFEAENYHQALMIVLNPPEQWFGRLGLLKSPEYLALKQGAKDEEKRVENLIAKGKRRDSSIKIVKQRGTKGEQSKTPASTFTPEKARRVQKQGKRSRTRVRSVAGNAGRTESVRKEAKNKRSGHLGNQRRVPRSWAELTGAQQRILSVLTKVCQKHDQIFEQIQKKANAPGGDKYATVDIGTIRNNSSFLQKCGLMEQPVRRGGFRQTPKLERWRAEHARDIEMTSE